MPNRSVEFRLGHTDAEVTAKEFGRMSSFDMLADLGRYEAMVKLLEDGANPAAHRQPQH